MTLYDHVDSLMRETGWKQIPAYGDKDWQPKLVRFFGCLTEIVRISKTIQDPDLEKALAALEL